jgi:hypothetical protein
MGPSLTTKSVYGIASFSAIVVGLSTFIAPTNSSILYGVTIPPISRPSYVYRAAISYLRAKGIREVGLGICNIIFMIRGQWDIVKTLMGVNCLIGCVDGWIVWSSHMGEESIRKEKTYGHILGTVLIGGLTVWEWARERRGVNFSLKNLGL